MIMGWLTSENVAFGFAWFLVGTVAGAIGVEAKRASIIRDIEKEMTAHFGELQEMETGKHSKE